MITISRNKQMTMKEDTKFGLVMLAICVTILGSIIGLIALASYIAERYGVAAGFLTIILPLFAATVLMIIILVKHGKKQ